MEMLYIPFKSSILKQPLFRAVENSGIGIYASLIRVLPASSWTECGF